MTFEAMLTIGVVLLYALATFTIFMGILSRHRGLQRAANATTLAGFGLHTLLTLATLASHSLDALSGGYFLQLLAWCIILIYLAAWRWLKLPFLALTAAPLALLLIIISLRLSSSGHVNLPENLVALFMGLHVSALFLSMGLLAMAFGAGIFFMYVENRIKRKAPLAEFARDLPALSTFDKVNRLAVTLGFPLYTLGLMAGFLWTPPAPDVLQGAGRLVSAIETPKVLVSLVIWFLYALLFYQRLALGYGGRRTALLAILIFVVTIFSFGIDYLFATHHSLLLQS